MKVMSLKRKLSIRVGFFQYELELLPGINYAVYDEDFNVIKRHGELLDVKDFPYPNLLKSGSRSVAFIMSGDFNTTLFDLQFLTQFMKRKDGIPVDVVCNIDQFFLLKQFGFKGGWIRYPVPVEFLKKYDTVLNNEIIYNSVRRPGREIIKHYMKIFETDKTTQMPLYSPWESIRRTVEDEVDFKKKILIHINSEQKINNFPKFYMERLIKYLTDRGYELILTGYPVEGNRDKEQKVISFVGEHTSILETIEMISRAGFVIGPDCAVSRAGAIMGIPTLIIMSTGDRDMYEMYKNVEVLLSSLPCSPCYSFDRCPLGYSECRGFYSRGLEPEKIVKKVEEILSKTEGKKESAYL